MIELSISPSEDTSEINNDYKLMKHDEHASIQDTQQYSNTSILEKKYWSYVIKNLRAIFKDYGSSSDNSRLERNLSCTN